MSPKKEKDRKPVWIVATRIVATPALEEPGENQSHGESGTRTFLFEGQLC